MHKINSRTFWFRSIFIYSIILLACSLTIAQVPLNEVTEVPSSSNGRFLSTTPPEVILGCAQIPDLADVDTTDWAYVRHHLDGIWLNAAGTGVADVTTLASGIKSKNYYFIGSISAVEYDQNATLNRLVFDINPGIFDSLITRAVEPKLVLVNDYITKQASDSLRYYGANYMQKAIEYAGQTYGDGTNPFGRRLFLTVRSGHFTKAVYNKTFDPSVTGDLVGKAFSSMQFACENGGVVWERSPMELANSPEDQATYIQAFNRSRELGGEFLWLVPRGNDGTPQDYTTDLVNCYNWFKQNAVFPDKIIIIHYSRAAADGEIEYLDMLPMINSANPEIPAPGSFTSALYWCIKQRENHLTVGINDQKLNDSKIRVYPNPATSLINIEGLESNSVVGIYSINGSLLLKREMSGNKVELDISSFTKGIYLLRGQTNDGYFVHKIVID